MGKFDTKTYLAQIGLASLGYAFGEGAKYGKIDGEDGPKTRLAIADFTAARQETITKQATAGAGTIALALVAVLMTRANFRETSQNQGPGIADYWPATSYPDGYRERAPYCAAFACWGVREATKGREVPFSLPKSALVLDWVAWTTANKGKGVELLDPKADGFKIRAGDICLMKFGGGKGHLFVSRGPGDTGQTLTIEANTDDALSREGDGTFAKVRSVASIYKVVRITV